MKNSILIAAVVLLTSFVAGSAACDQSIGGYSEPDQIAFHPVEVQRVPAAPVCGNGTVEAGEECDGNPVQQSENLCKELGFDYGAVGCYHDCTYNTNKCIICGDDEAAEGETCDGSDLRGTTCQDLGYSGGTLTCNATCQEYDESGCNTY